MKRLSLSLIPVLILFVTLTYGQTATACGWHSSHCGGGYCTPYYDDWVISEPCGGGVIWGDPYIPNPNNGGIPNPNPNNGGIPNPNPNNGGIPNPNPNNLPDPNPNAGSIRSRALNQALVGLSRTWIYDAPRRTIVLGSLERMENGQVSLRRQSGDVVKVPLWQLTATDQKIVVSQLGGGERTWRDASQRYQRTAKFAGVNGDRVVLKTTHGKMVTIPFSKLSASDQCVVRHLHRAPIGEDLAAPQKEHFVAIE